MFSFVWDISNCVFVLQIEIGNLFNRRFVTSWSTQLNIVISNISAFFLRSICKYEFISFAVCEQLGHLASPLIALEAGIRFLSQQTFVLMKTSWRRLQDVLITTNMFALAFKTSSRCLGQDQYIRLGHMSSRLLQDVLVKTNIFVLAIWRLQDVFKASSRRLQDVFKTYSRHPAKISSRRFQGVPSS